MLNQRGNVPRRLIRSEQSRMNPGWRHQEAISRSRMASKVKEMQNAVVLCPEGHNHRNWPQANNTTEEGR